MKNWKGTFVAVLWALVGALPVSAGGDRSRSIDFEDQLVEGVNRQPLDSLSQLSDDAKKRQKMHLYRKRAGYRDENPKSLKELRDRQ